MTDSTENLFTELREAIKDRSIGREPYPTVLEELAPHEDDLLDLFQRWIPPLQECLERCEDRRADSILVMAVADTVTKSGANLPEWFSPYLKLIPMGARFLPEGRALELMSGMDDDALAHAIEVTFEREYFARSVAHELVLRIEDKEILDRIVRFVASDSSADKLAPVFAHAIDRILPILAAKWKEKPTENTIKLCLMLANQRSSPEDDDLYIDGLGHKTRGIREYARVGLADRGEGARDLLERGVSARRKAVREWCSAQLDALEVAGGDDGAQDHFALLPEAEQEAMGEKIDALYNAKKGAWTRWLNSNVEPDPMLWLFATLALFDRNPDFIHRWQVLKVLCTATQTTPHHKELWSVYLTHLARAPALSSSHTRWHLEKQFALVPSDFEEEVFEQALFNATAPMSVPMFVHYFSSGYCAPALFAQGLEHKSKKVRDAALARASSWPASQDAERVVALLAARKKGTRQYAAEALNAMPAACTFAHLDRLSLHLDGEKVADVKAALAAVIAKHTTA